MSSYKHGKPVYKLSRKPLFVIVTIVLVIIGALYYFLVARAGSDTLKNNNKLSISHVKASPTNTDVSLPYFSVSLPGIWKLTAQNWDARYVSWQWSLQDKKSADSKFEVYFDTIPTDRAVNYLMPVTADGSTLQTGTLSDNCVNFTPGASPTTDRPTYTPLSKASLPSKWQQVNFLCDNTNVSHQVVGIGSLGNLNSVTLNGPITGVHKFFLLYNDSNFTPNFSVFTTILGSFQAK